MSGARRWLKTIVIRIGAIAVLLGAAQYVFTSDSRAQFDDLRSDYDRVQREKEELATQNQRLRLQIAGIQHDDRYLEQVAREEFGMIKKGEILYRFSED